MTVEQLEKMRLIIERLKTFNRKERDHLLKYTLCQKPGEPQIIPEFWELVSGPDIDFPDPERIFWGMDYHLNWLFAALHTADLEPIEPGCVFDNCWGLEKEHLDKIEPIITKKKNGEIKKVDKDKRPIQGNPEDVDLLVAWVDKQESSLRLTLIEAKLDSPWNLKQLKSKMQRFSLIQAASYKMGLGWIDWNCLLLSPEKNHGGNNPDESAISEEYEKTLRKFCDRSKPMSWRWEPWNGCLPPDGRRHVNRVKGNHTKWEITQKLKDGAP